MVEYIRKCYYVDHVNEKGIVENVCQLSVFILHSCWKSPRCPTSFWSQTESCRPQKKPFDIWKVQCLYCIVINGVTLSVSTLLSTPSYSVRLNPQWWWSDTGGGCWCSYWSWRCILYRQTGNDEETQVLSRTSWPKHVGQDLLIFSITYKSVLVIEMVSNTFVGLFQVWLQPRIYFPWLQRTVSSSHWEWWGGIATKFWTIILEVFCEPCNSHITV